MFIHGVFPVWTASCEFLIFCPCGHVWDVKWIWPKFLAADETGGKRLPVLRCILPFQGSKTSTDKTSGETVKWIPKKTYQSMMLFRKFSWGLRNHHGQASLGILHHIFIGHGMLKSWVVSLDWTLNLQNCFASNPTPKKLQTMRDKEHCFFWKMLQSFHYPASCCGLGAQSIDVPLPGKLWEDQDSLWVFEENRRKLTTKFRMPSHMCFWDLTPPQLVLPANFLLFIKTHVHETDQYCESW